MLKKWILLPLIDKSQIENRLDIVEELQQEAEVREEINIQLKKIGDLERLTSKIPSSKINPKEINYLLQALLTLPEIKKIIKASGLKHLQIFTDQFNDCKKLCKVFFFYVECLTCVAMLCARSSSDTSPMPCASLRGY